MDSPTVLCIDDLPQALELRKATLESHGYCVEDRIERPHRYKDVGGNVGGCGSTGVQTGRHGRGSRARRIKQRFPNLPIILLSAYSEMPERILWWVDEYVMKSELPERLVPIIERTHRLGPHSDKRLQRKEAAA